MKKSILLAAAICAVLMVKAGDESLTSHHFGGHSSSGGGKFTLGISVGAALPMSEFGTAKKDSTINSTSTIHNGFAKTGIHFDVSATYLIAGPFGLEAILGGNLNSYDAAAANSQYFPHGGVTRTAPSYFIGQYMAGPALSFPAGALSVNIHAVVGLVTANYPTTTDTYSSGGTTVTTGPSLSTFGYNAGLGVKFNLSGNIGLLVDVSYIGIFSSAFDYTPLTSTTTYLGTGTDQSNYNMTFSMVTISAGIAFSF